MGNTRAKPIDVDLVRSLFDYKNGQLVWAVNKGRAKIGDKSHDHNSGRKVLKINGKIYLEHRLVWVWHGLPEPKFIDHINGNPVDNRIENLRAATTSENMRNAMMRSDNKSGVKGVSWCKSKKKWLVQLWYDGKQQYLGRYKDLDKAKEVVLSARLLNHGAFANTGV